MMNDMTATPEEPRCDYLIASNPGKKPNRCVRPLGHGGKHRPAGYYEAQRRAWQARFDAMSDEEKSEMYRAKNARRSDRRKELAFN